MFLSRMAHAEFAPSMLQHRNPFANVTLVQAPVSRLVIVQWNSADITTAFVWTMAPGVRSWLAASLTPDSLGRVPRHGGPPAAYTTSTTANEQGSAGRVMAVRPSILSRCVKRLAAANVKG